jgi:hypothetical protein
MALVHCRTKAMIGEGQPSAQEKMLCLSGRDRDLKVHLS